MQPAVHPFFEPATWTVSYAVDQKACSERASVIDTGAIEARLWPREKNSWASSREPIRQARGRLRSVGAGGV
jgi:hypothetical protein